MADGFGLGLEAGVRMGWGMVVPLKPALQAGVASRRDKAMRTTATGGGGGAASGSKNILTAAQCNQRSRKV